MAPDRKPSVRKVILLATLQYGLGFALLGYLIWTHQDGLTQVSEKPKHPLPFLVAVGLLFAALLLTFVRWYTLVRAVDLPFRLFNAIRLGLVGFFFSTFLPGSIGGDIAKAAFLAREQQRRTVAVSTVIIDRGAALWGLCWFVALLGAVFWSLGHFSGESGVLKQMVRFAWLIVGGGLAAWFILGFLPPHRAEIFARRLERLPAVGGSAAEAWRAIWMYRQRGFQFWLAILLAMIGHVGFVLVFYFAARTLYPADQIPSLAVHFMIVPILMTINAIPLTPGGLGVGETAAQELYRLVGAVPEHGLFAAVVYRVVVWTVAFLGYLIYLQMRPRPDNVNPGTSEATGIAISQPVAE